MSLQLTINNAALFLTAPLVARLPPTTLTTLRSALAANLTITYATNWFPDQPLRGSGRRCLSLAPTGAPPRPIHNACLSANVSWQDWFALLGDEEFDLFIDPGHISIRYGLSSLVTIWSDDKHTHEDKSLSQLLQEHDEHEDQVLFSMIADHVSEPTWMTPTLDRFPPMHIRSSSRSSTLSAFSDDTDSTSSTSTAPSPIQPPRKASRRERARQARVFVDNSKTQVTPYDGGKTTVLTGGVMLGAPQGPSRKNRRF